MSPAPDRHKTAPKAVRMPDGLQARVEAVLADGEKMNGFIVAAIEAEVERRAGGSTAPAKPRSGSTTRRPRAKPVLPRTVTEAEKADEDAHRERARNAARKNEPESASDMAAYFRRRNGGQ